MINPHPPRFRIKRRNTVSVTPAMGANTVAGEIVTAPIRTCAGTIVCASGAAAETGLSQNFLTRVFYLPRVWRRLWGVQTRSTRPRRSGRRDPLAQPRASGDVGDSWPLPVAEGFAYATVPG